MGAAAISHGKPAGAPGTDIEAAAESQSTSGVPLEVYLHTVYRPDCEYVDGQVLERNLGEIPHARIQGFFSWLFRSREAEWKLAALPEQRVQVRPERFRIPDICIVPLRIEDKRIVRTAPLLCIEVLSAEDRMIEMQERVDDYLRMGVRAVWLIDPRRRKAYLAEAEGKIAPVTETLMLAGTEVQVPLAEVFAELDRYESQ